MRYLRNNTATLVTVGPFYGTDGLTIKTALSIPSERISMVVDSSSGTVPIMVINNISGTTAGTNNDLNYITGAFAGMMQLELSAANTSYFGRAMLSITDATNHTPVFHEFDIIPGQVYDSLVLGTDLLDVSTAQLAGQTVTAAAGVTFPTSVASPTNITSGTLTTVVNLTNNQAKYMNGAVWINTVSGVAGTVSYTNGIMTNPSDSLPNAKTIADNIFLKKFWIQAGSTIPLAAAMTNYILEGEGWSLTSSVARDISGSTIRGCENITGTFTSPTRECYVYDSQLGASSWGEVDFHGCHIVGIITLNAATPFLFDRCIGVGNPTINFNSTADARSAIFSNIGGAFTFTNMKAGNVLYIGGNADITIAASCTAGTIYINGAVSLTNNGSATIVDTSRWGEEQNITNVTGVTSTTTNLTNLPSITANWLTGAGVDATAVTKIQAGLATPTNIVSGTITNLTNLPATAATASSIAALNNLSSAQAQSASSAALTAYGAATSSNVTSATSGLASQASVNAIPTGTLLTGDTRLNNLNAPIGSIPTNPLLTNDSRLNYIAAIPTGTLLTTDARLNNLDATISSRSTLTDANVWGYANRSLTTGSSSITASDVWTYSSRSLTTGSSTDIVGIWSYNNRSLTTGTGGGASASEVWNYANRSLTTGTGGISASDVWTYNNRSLNSGTPSITTLDVWTYGSRSLTSGTVTPTDVWSYNNRSLNSGTVGITANDVWTFGNRSLTTTGTPSITASDVWTYADRELTSGSFDPSQVWSYGIRTLTAGAAPSVTDIDNQLTFTHGGGSWKEYASGTGAAEIWSYFPRSLTQTAPQLVQNLADNSQVNVYKNSTFAFTLNNLPDFSSYQKLWLTVKEFPDLELNDSESIIQIQTSLVTGTAGDGLLYINKQAASPADGYIQVLSATSLTVSVKSGVTYGIPTKKFSYGIKYVDNLGNTIPLVEDAEFVVNPSTSKKVM